MAEIETARVRLRMFTMDDLDDLAKIFGNPRVMRYMGVAGVAVSREETEVALESIIRHWKINGFGRWAVVDKETGRLIGSAGLRSFEGVGEVVYLLDESHWGRGLATEIAIASMHYGFQVRNFDHIIAFTRPDNIPSRRVMEKVGMKYVGEQTIFSIFCVHYSITKEEFYANHPHLINEEEKEKI